VIISIPEFSGELEEGVGRLTVNFGSGTDEGIGPVAKVMSGLATLSVIPEHCVCDRKW